MIECYLSGGCLEEVQQSIETHIAKCQQCRQRVESLRLAKDACNRPGLDQSVSHDPDDKTQTYEIKNEYATKTISLTPSNSGASPVFAGPSESVFEGYEILDQLPPGGQAVVYKAIQKATKRVVALKVLLQGAQTSAIAQYRFEREVDLAASLQHPNIVTIYDSGIAKGQYYFAMQYIEGIPLDKYVQTENLSMRQTMELLNKVCSAVAYAHQRGVMHRDLKPGNILADNDGQPNILDFGLAKLIDGSEQTSSEMQMTSIPGKIIGTLAFMSPEQASAQPETVDIRTDVYSIGVILYKILTKEFPYDVKGSMLSILRNIQEIEPISPSKILPRFNSDVEAILLKALAKDPAVRYQSAAHLQQDIDCWLKGLPIAAKSGSTIYLLRKIITKHRYVSSVIALLVTIVFGFSCLYYQLYSGLRSSHTTLQATMRSLNEETARYSRFAGKLMFDDFLGAWRTGDINNSKFIAKYFTRGTREAQAAFFLLAPHPLVKKAAEFRQALEKDEPCFVEFIIAEHYLKDGDKTEAIRSYQKCLSQKSYLEKDPWLATHAKSRLYELTGVNLQEKSPPTFENQDLQ